MIKDYFVYIVECKDGSYSTGVTPELEKRIIEHNSGFYKVYTSTRLPVKLVYSNRFTEINDAIKAEKQIKEWSRGKKEALIIGDFELIKLLSKGKL